MRTFVSEPKASQTTSGQLGTASERTNAPSVVHEAFQSSGQPLDAATRAFMEPRFAHDFSSVRVHADGKAAAAASSMGARAFTLNPHIVFGAGEYAPHTRSGRRLLAHELTHVVQPATRLRTKLTTGQRGDHDEQEADRNAVAIGGDAPSAASVKGQGTQSLAKTSTTANLAADSKVGGSPASQQKQGVDASKNGNRDDAVRWWLPFGERIAQWGFGDIVAHVNVDKKTITDYAGPWARNAFDSAIFAVGTGIATEVVLKRVKLAQNLLKGLGMAVGGAIAYKGLDIRERIRCMTIETQRWYGRYRYHYGRKEILAVEYWGKEPAEVSSLSPVYYEQAIVDGDGNVLYVNTDTLSYFGIELTANAVTLPLFSYGKIDPD